MMRCLTVLALLTISLARGQQGLLLDQRVTDWARATSSIQLPSATRYVPVAVARGLGTWSAPENTFSFMSMPFEAFPLNLVSADYFPADLLILDSVSIVQRPALSESGSFAGGVIEVFPSEIPDTLVIGGRVFGGSETGDVILHEYTRDNLAFCNRNKIGFSGSGSISNKVHDVGYRLTVGSFSYFSTGYADRDKILIPYINLPTFSRPNRHTLGSLELTYGARDHENVVVFGGFNAFQAWEHVPFLPSFGFFSGTLGTIRVSMERVIPFVDLFAKRDAVDLSMQRQLGAEGGSYRASVVSANPVLRVPLAGKIALRVPVSYALHSVDVDDNNRQFFLEDRQKENWSVGIQLRVESDDWRVEADGRYEKGINGSRLRSATIGIIQPSGDPGSIELHAGSVERSPTLLEMYGEYTMWRYRPDLARNDTLRVQGNDQLKTSRSTGIEIVYTLPGEPRIRGTFFSTRTENLVRRVSSGALRSAYPGDLVLPGRYANVGSRTLAGLEIETDSKLTDRVNVTMRYSFSANKHAPEVPRHQVMAGVTVILIPSTMIRMSVKGISKTRWEEFRLDPARDEKSGIGSDGIAPEYWSVDCSFVQDFGSTWFLNNVTARLEMQNLLNREQRTFPIGVTTDFAVIGYVTFRL